jgi:hypothetical protein
VIHSRPMREHSGSQLKGLVSEPVLLAVAGDTEQTVQGSDCGDCAEDAHLDLPYANERGDV